MMHQASVASVSYCNPLDPALCFTPVAKGDQLTNRGAQPANQLHPRDLLNYLDRLFVHGNELALHTQRNGRFDIFERDRTA